MTKPHPWSILWEDVPEDLRVDYDWYRDRRGFPDRCQLAYKLSDGMYHRCGHMAVRGSEFCHVHPDYIYLLPKAEPILGE